MEDFISPYSAVYLRIQKWKNYWNRSTFDKVIVKIKVARFLWPTVYICHLIRSFIHSLTHSLNFNKITDKMLQYGRPIDKVMKW